VGDEIIIMSHFVNRIEDFCRKWALEPHAPTRAAFRKRQFFCEFLYAVRLKMQNGVQKFAKKLLQRVAAQALGSSTKNCHNSNMTIYS